LEKKTNKKTKQTLQYSKLFIHLFSDKKQHQIAVGEIS
jgi:hypothetical protein